MSEKTPRNVRQAEFSGDRLNAVCQKSFVPDGSGLHDRTILNAIWKHPVFLLPVDAFLQPKQTVNVVLRQPDRTIHAVVLGCMQLTLIDGADDLEFALLRIEVLPLKGDLLRTNRGHSDEPGRRGDRLLQTANQQRELIARREFLFFLDTPGGRSALQAGLDEMYPYFTATKIELSPHFKFLRVCTALPSFAFWLMNRCTASGVISG